MEKLAIIIINYNNSKKTIECIDSIWQTYDGDYMIYLLDNASGDDSASILKEKYSNCERIRLILSDENLGYARGNNRCLEMAIEDGFKYALVSNNDIVFKEHAIESLLKQVSSGKYLAVGPKILRPDGVVQKSIKLKRPSFQYYFWHDTYLQRFVRDKGQDIPNEPTEVYWLSGCLFMFNLHLFKSIGFFDPYTFLFFEEYIVSEKAFRNGLKLLYYNEAEVVHYHGASMGGPINMVTRKANWRSESYLIKEYFGWGVIKCNLLWRLRCLEVKYNLRKEDDRKKIFKDFYKAGKVYVRTGRVIR